MDSTQLEKHADLHSRLDILIHRPLLSLICCYDNSKSSRFFYPLSIRFPTMLNQHSRENRMLATRQPSCWQSNGFATACAVSRIRVVWRLIFGLSKHQ